MCAFSMARALSALISRAIGSEASLLHALDTFRTENYGENPIDPDAWAPFAVRAPANIPAKLRQVAGEKYSYRELDNFTDEIVKRPARHRAHG